MELVVRGKNKVGHFKCLPGFINILNDGRFMVREGYVEVYREMAYYDVYIKPDDKWVDLNYAYEEGFLDPEELRKWP
jgi:hypothetical protein